MFYPRYAEKPEIGFGDNIEKKLENLSSSLPNEERVLEYGDHGMSVTTIAICLLIRIAWRAWHVPQMCHAVWNTIGGNDHKGVMGAAVICFIGEVHIGYCVFSNFCIVHV